MAEMTAKKRNNLKNSDFALPGRRYPIHDLAHARNALARVEQNGSDDEKRQVKAAVYKRYPNLRPSSTNASLSTDFFERDDLEFDAALDEILDLVGLSDERIALIAEGKIELAVEVGKPGTNWKQVTPEAKRRLKGILNKYRKDPHPFAACVRDNTKRFGGRVNKVCAVVKDLIERTTNWRKGGNHSQLSTLSLECPVLPEDVVALLSYVDPVALEALGREYEDETDKEAHA